MRNRVPLALLVVFATACAQVREISGGDKDEQAPVLLESIPRDQSTRFTGDRIILRFDERIQLDRARDRLLISPPLSEPPTVRITGPREVTISLNAALLPNTTYVLGIGEAVKDLTEGNAAQGLDLVFSTGPILDSLSVSGIVVNAFSGAPEKDVMVMLYAPSDTASLRIGRPAYATRCDKDGRFHLRNLPAGAYTLHGLRDQNGNYRYDLPNEEIAFHGDVNAMDHRDTTTSPIVLRLFQEAPQVQLLREARTLNDGALRVVFARPAKDIHIRDVARTGGSLQWSTEWNRDRDTVLLWPSDTTLLQEGRYALSTEEGVLDTVRYRPLTPMPYRPTVSATLMEQDNGAEIVLTTTRPIARLDSTAIQVLEDSLPIAIRVERTSDRTAHLRGQFRPGASYTVRVLPNAFTDRYGGQNDSLTVRLGRAAENSTGTLRITLRTEAVGPFLLQLLDGQGRSVRTQRLTPPEMQVIWERLQPGLHSLRLIQDNNDNGRWDTGILNSTVQPENVWPYTGTVNVRAAWDLGVEWTLE